MPAHAIAIIGEVLYDRLPDGRLILGGAPFNVAWHLNAFGQQPLFISRVGNDAPGRDIRAAMQSWGMETGLLQTDHEHPTGIVEVGIVNGEPNYHILDRQAYDFIDAEALDGVLDCGIVYHGTLALRHRHSQQAVERLKSHHTGKVFVDVNLRAPWWQAAHVHAWLNDADWLKLNEDELMQLAPRAADLQTTMQALIERYGLETLVVTRGARGATALTNAGDYVETTPTGGLVVADTIGAGDAFAAVLLLGLHRVWPLALTMTRAQAFASALVTQPGATVHDPAFYRPFVADWALSQCC